MFLEKPRMIGQLLIIILAIFVSFVKYVGMLKIKILP